MANPDDDGLGLEYVPSEWKGAPPPEFGTDAPKPQPLDVHAFTDASGPFTIDGGIRQSGWLASGVRSRSGGRLGRIVVYLMLAAMLAGILVGVLGSVNGHG